MNFFDKLSGAIAHHQSILYIGLDPTPEQWPDLYDCIGTRAVAPLDLQPLQDWLDGLIAQTAGLICAYKLNPEFYRVLGEAGLGLLRHVLKAIPRDVPIILDANHGDLNSSTIVAQSCFLDWRVDAVTLNPYAGQDQAVPFLVYPDKAVFVLCSTTNPAAQALQSYPSPDRPFYLHLVQEVKTWGTPEQIGLEVGAVTPAVLAQIREVAPERLILARSVWTEGSDLRQILAAGLNSNGNGLLIPVSPEMVAQPQPASLIWALRDEINQIRQEKSQSSPACSLWAPDVCLLHDQPHQDLILQLYDIGCLQFGEFVQASGAVFPYYIDLRTIISNPQVFDKVIAAYAEVLKLLQFDRIAGIPYGALPTATGLALRLNYPMIFPRKEVKAHGTRRMVEGHFQPGETAVVVDDILITGNSAMEGAGKLQSVGLKVKDIVVFIDHQKGVKDTLRQQGYEAHSVLTISEIAETLHEAGRLTDDQLAALA